MIKIKESKYNENIIIPVTAYDLYEKKYEKEKNPKGYTIFMGIYQMRIYKYLIEKIQRANFQEIQITMKKNNHHITIEPCTQSETISSIKDIEFFIVTDIDTEFYLELSGDSLAELTGILAHYDRFYENRKNQSAEQSLKLKMFYQEHLNKPEPFREDAKNLMDYMCKYENLKEKKETSISQYTQIYMREKQISNANEKELEEYIKELIQYINDGTLYSDWYKNVHGKRP